MKKVLFLLAAAAVLAIATPASAHEEINPATITIGAPHFLVLTAANEKSVDLTSIKIEAPDGAGLGETAHSPAGWTADHTQTTITWTGGTVPSAGIESWEFETEGVDQPGTITYKVTLGYADGTSDPVDVPIKAVVATAATKKSKSGGNTTKLVAVVALGAALVALAIAVLAYRGGRHGPRRAGSGGQNW
jgi:uncharacterized protein YcnI